MIRSRFSAHAFLLAGVAALLPLSAASAQVPSFSAPPYQAPTFAASFTGLAVPQTAAMDAVCLVGSATKTLRVLRVAVSGVDATAQTANINLVKRTVASTGGTSSNATVVKLDSLSGAATGVLTGYTVANTPGAGVALRAAAIGFGAATTATPQQIVWEFNPQLLQQPLTLRGVAQSACVNIPAALTTAGVALNVDVTWTELQ